MLNLNAKPQKAETAQAFSELEGALPSEPARLPSTQALELNGLVLASGGESCVDTEAALANFCESIGGSFSESEQRLIMQAARLAIEVHADQGRRLDGLPFVNHPFEVALNLLHFCEVRRPDLVCAALLHDAVEDQARRLAARLPQGGLDSGEERDRALEVIALEFNPHVARLVGKLTNADFGGMAEKESQAGNRRSVMTLKNQFYQKHVLELALSRDLEDQEAFAVKWADFGDNAFRHSKLPCQSPAERDTKTRLEHKRAGLLGFFKDYLAVLPEGHPLYPVRLKLAEATRELYQQQYLGIAPGPS